MTATVGKSVRQQTLTDHGLCLWSRVHDGPSTPHGSGPVAEVNATLGLLDTAKASAIAAAAARVAAGEFDAEFPLSVWQTGSGMQTHMNVNEVVAHLATLALGGRLDGAPAVHPNDDVNLGQSSNPLVPGAMGACILGLFGDSITTDHISPGGSFTERSPAGPYLLQRGVAMADFNGDGARRGHHQVMLRGTLANVRIKNLMLPLRPDGSRVEGGFTRIGAVQVDARLVITAPGRKVH